MSSIGAIKLNVLLSKAFDAAVTTRDLKENDTIEKLEKFFMGSTEAETFEVQPDYGITKTQERIFVECVSKPDSMIYNIPILLEISKGLEISRLKTTRPLRKLINY